MDRPFFSILIPVYNQEEYLKACLDSVLNQTMNDYEIVIVNDGSTDQSKKIYEDYHSKYPDKIIVYEKQNEGLFFARRDGIRLSSGKYLLFLDSDDMLRNDALYCLQNEIKKIEADMVIFNGSYTPDFKTMVKRFPFSNGTVFRKEEKKLFIQKFCGYHTFNNLCLKCVSKKIIDVNEYKTKKVMNYGEDLYQTIPFVDRADVICIFDESLYYYRQHESSLTHKYNPEQFESLKGVAERLIKYSTKWEEEYHISLKDNLERYFGIECYRTVKNIVKDCNCSLKQKKEQIYKIEQDDFYKKWKPSKNAQYLRFYEKIINSIISNGSSLGILILSAFFSMHK